MVQSIEKEINSVIEASIKNFEGNELLVQYEDASKKFEDLVKKGLVKKRGYNLLSITESHLHRSRFNSPNDSSHHFITNL